MDERENEDIIRRHLSRIQWIDNWSQLMVIETNAGLERRLTTDAVDSGLLSPIPLFIVIAIQMRLIPNSIVFAIHSLVVWQTMEFNSIMFDIWKLFTTSKECKNRWIRRLSHIKGLSFHLTYHKVLESFGIFPANYKILKIETFLHSKSDLWWLLERLYSAQKGFGCK